MFDRQQKQQYQGEIGIHAEEHLKQLDATVDQEQGFGDHFNILGKDLDEESSAQNFRNIARQGDLSPRHNNKGKSATKGRNKNAKESAKNSSVLPLTKIQTRRALTKSNNL